MFNFFSTQDFKISFYSNLFSTLIVTVGVGLVLNFTTNLFKKPDLKFVVKQNGSYRDTILLTKRQDGNYEATFQLAIRNDGNQLFKPNEGYWHTYIKLSDGEQSSFSDPIDPDHQRGPIDNLILPKSFFDLPIVWKFVIKKEDVKTADVPYFFSTTYGYFPKTVTMDQKTGVVPFSGMAKIGYEIPE